MNIQLANIIDMPVNEGDQLEFEDQYFKDRILKEIEIYVNYRIALKLEQLEKEEIV